MTEPVRNPQPTEELRYCLECGAVLFNDGESNVCDECLDLMFP